MKTFMIMSFFLLVFQVNAFSQKLYVKSAFSISMAAVPQQYTTSSSYYFSGGSYVKTVYEMEKGSYGAGLWGKIGLGTMLTQNFGFELETSYLAGRPQESYFNMFVDDRSDKFTTESFSRMLAFAPSFLVRAKGNLISPYAKAGILIGRPKLIQETTRVFPPGQGVYTSTFEVTGKTAFGLQGGLGAHIKITEKLSLFSEVTFAMLSFTPVKGKAVSYIAYGEDHVHSLSESQKTVDYVPSYSTSEEGDAHKPRKVHNYPLPFNSVGIQVGLQFDILQ